MVASLALGEAPKEGLQALRTGEVTALLKQGGDVRPVVVGTTLRRLGLRALSRVKKEAVACAVGPHQYGMGLKAGAQLLVQRLSVQKELRPNAAFVKVDQQTALQKVERGPAAEALEAAVAELSGALRAGYTGGTTHLWRNTSGSFEELCSNRGFDQGCPVAAATFSVAQKTALEPWLAELLLHDPQAKLYSYLDDTYFVVDKCCVGQALKAMETAHGPLGLTLNPDKTVVWSPAGPEGLPAELLRYYAPALPLLGKHLTVGGDMDEAPVALGGEVTGGLAAATSRLSSLWMLVD